MITVKGEFMLPVSSKGKREIVAGLSLKRVKEYTLEGEKPVSFATSIKI